MKYKIVRLGDSEHLVDLPESHQFDIHVVGLIASKGKFIATHASLYEVVELRPHIEKISIKTSFIQRNIADDEEELTFTLNGCSQWKQYANGKPICWLAWYAGSPESLFFIPREFVGSDNFKLCDDTLGIFDVTTKEVVLKGLCSPFTTMETITEIL